MDMAEHFDLVDTFAEEPDAASTIPLIIWDRADGAPETSHSRVYDIENLVY